MANLTGQNISSSYQSLVTLGTGTTITDGTGSLITNLAVTASWAQNAVTASFALNAGSQNTGSLMVTGSVSSNVLTFTKGDGSAFNLTVNTGSAVTVNTGSLMVTGSATNNVITFTKGDGSTFNVTVATGSAVTVNTGSLMATGSASGNVLTFTKGDGSTFNLTVATGSTAVTASYALDAERLGGQLPAFYATATSVTNLSSSVASRLTTDEAIIGSLVAATSSYALKTEVSGAFASTSASFSTRLTTDEAIITSLVAATGSYALKTEVSGAFNSVSSSFATRLTTDEAIITSLVAATASYARTNVNNTFTGTQTFNNIAVNGTASIGYLESVTGSAKIVGDAFIILNNDTPALRYAGIKVIDSGSANVTASFLFDGQTNDWFYEYESGDPTNFGVVLFGPEYGTLGSPIYPTANQLQKGTGGHHMTGSNISDNGALVTVSVPVSVTGAVTASAGFSGNLAGNASTATSASFATFANTAGSASTSTSASFATTALTASFALTAPYSGLQGSVPTWNQNTTGNAATSTTASFALTASFYAGSVVSASYATFASTAETANTASYVTGQADGGLSGDLQFSNILGEIYGNAFAPITGNLTISGISIKKQGAVVVVFHTGSVEPSVSGGTIAKKVGNYSTTDLNIITFTKVVGNNYLEYIAGAPITSVASASYAVTASFATTAGSAATSTSASYAVTASFAQNATNIFPFIGDARITGSLSITGSIASSNVVSNFTDTFTASDPISQIVTCTQAEYNTVSGSANASRTLYVITDATGGGQFVSGSLTSNVNALAIASSTASMDCQAGNFFTLTLAASATTNLNPTNIQAGQTINVRIIQPTPSTGSISFASTVKQVSGSAYTPTALASAQDIITFVAFDTSSLYLANLKKFV